jgi:hypothetical protein
MQISSVLYKVAESICGYNFSQRGMVNTYENSEQRFEQITTINA